jgi:hypothetical protein
METAHGTGRSLTKQLSLYIHIYIATFFKVHESESSNSNNNKKTTRSFTIINLYDGKTCVKKDAAPATRGQRAGQSVLVDCCFACVIPCYCGGRRRLPSKPAEEKLQKLK